MKTVFGKTLANMDPVELQKLLDDCMAASLVPKERLQPAVRKRLERMTRQWEEFVVLANIPEDMAFHQTTFVQHARQFIRTLLSSTKGSKANGLVAYGTLSQWCSTLVQDISRHCVDNRGERTGAAILRSGLPGSRDDGLFQQIIDECRSLFHQFQMDKRIPRKAPMGRYEAQRVVEEALGRNGCKEADIMLSLSVAIATVTALRPGSLGYSHAEWDGQEGRIGKFLKNKDIEIRRDLERGEGAFLVTVTAEHIKGRNGDEAFTPIEFSLRSLGEPQNVPFDPVNYILPLLHHRGELLDYVDKPYEDVLKGEEYKLRIGNPDLPFFRKVSNGGYSMDPDPTKAMSAKSINARFSRCAESAGLKPKGGRGISFTGFRSGLATEIADLFGESTASMVLAHQDEEILVRKHYTSGVSAWDMSGIVFGEIKAGDQEHAKRALALNLFRRPAIRLSMLEQMERLADGLIPMDDDGKLESEEGEDETAAVGSKRKRVVKAPVVSRSTRANLDSEEESAIVAELVAAIPEVKLLQEQADEAWQEFCDVTAERPIRGNDWKRFLTWDEDEEVPEGWSDVELSPSWGKAEVRMKRCAEYDKINTQLLALVKKQKRKVREQRRKERSLEMEKKKDQVSLKAAREAEKALQQPSKLLHHVLPTLSTTTTNDATAGPSGSTEVHVAAAEDDDDTTGDASVLPEDVQVLEEDVECRFFLGVIPAGEDSERSPIHSKIHAFLYSEGPKSDEGGPSSKPAQPEKTQSSSKGKGKGKAAEIEEEIQWQDDGDENTKFDEKVSSPFDERRQKELEKALKLAPPAEFRAGWQLFLADLMLSDKELAPRTCPRCPESGMTYCRAKLQRHLDNVHTVLDAHFEGGSWEEFTRKVRVGETDRFKLRCARRRKLGTILPMC